MIDAVIFDFDGTLADTSELIIKSFQTVYRQFMGEERTADYISASFGEPLKVTIEREFTQPFDEVFKVYKSYQNDRFDKEVKLFNNVKETLKYLKTKNIKTAVVTSRIRQSVVDALKSFEIFDYFDEIIAVDDTENHKPHPEPLLKAINLLSTLPSKVLYVGDSKFDIECAKSAGAIPVLVGWHTNSNELRTTYDVKFMVNDLFEITQIV